MADVASGIESWSVTAGSNSPSDSTSIGAGLADNLQQIQATVRTAFAHKGADIASATTTDIGAIVGAYHDITGTTTITGLGTVSAGIRKVLQFDSALTLTHHATQLIIPGGANITTAAGDTIGCMSLGSGNWQVLWANTVAGISFTQAGTGAVVRSGLAKMREWVTPLDYGATGDGSTTDTTEFQAAVDAATALFLPAGYNFKVGTITIPATLKHIFGVGWNSKITQAAADSDVFQAADPDGLSIENFQFVGVAGDFENTGNNAVQITGSTTTIGDGNNVCVRKCLFKNFRHYAILAQYVLGIDVIDNTFDGCTHGARLDSCKNWKYRGNIVNASQYTGGVTVGLSAQTNGAATASTHNQNGSIIGNTVTGHDGGQAILVHDSKKIAIIGNTLEDNLMNIWVAPASGLSQLIQDVSIVGNPIEGAATGTDRSLGNNGIQVSGDAAGSTATNIVIASNPIRGTGQIVDNSPAIGIGANVETISISGNPLHTCTGVAIGLEAGDITNVDISANNISDMVADGGSVKMGIRIYSTAGTVTGKISNNYVADCTQGIRDDNSTAVKVFGNEFDNCTDDVYLTPTGLQVFGQSDGSTPPARWLVASKTFNPSSLADGANETTTVTVTGAVLGDYAIASFSLDLQSITLSGYVSSADTVTCLFQNESGGVLDLASGTLRASVLTN